MTGHMYKKCKRSSSDGQRGGSDTYHVIMHEGDTSGSGSVTSESDRNSNTNHHGRISSRGRMTLQLLDRLLDSVRLQMCIIGLVALNTAFVVVSLLLQLRQPSSVDDQSSSALISSSSAPLLLRYASTAVLALFVVEQLLKAVVWRQRFFRRRLELFDALLILLTFTLTLAFDCTVTDGADDTDEKDGKHPSVYNGFALLVILRLWRITKILNGLLASVRTEAEHRVKREQRRCVALEREVAKLREYCLQQECELQMYRVMLQQNNIPQPTVIRVPPNAAPRTLSVIAEVNELDDGECVGLSSSDDEEMESARRLQPMTSAVTTGVDVVGGEAPPPEYSECDHNRSPPYAECSTGGYRSVVAVHIHSQQNSNE